MKLGSELPKLSTIVKFQIFFNESLSDFVDTRVRALKVHCEEKEPMLLLSNPLANTVSANGLQVNRRESRKKRLAITSEVKGGNLRVKACLILRDQ